MDQSVHCEECSIALGVPASHLLGICSRQLFKSSPSYFPILRFPAEPHLGIPRLEQSVIDAAISLVTMNKPTTPAHAYMHAYNDLNTSVVALLAERERK